MELEEQVSDAKIQYAVHELLCKMLENENVIKAKLLKKAGKKSKKKEEEPEEEVAIIPINKDIE